MHPLCTTANSSGWDHAKNDPKADHLAPLLMDQLCSVLQSTPGLGTELMNHFYIQSSHLKSRISKCNSCSSFFRHSSLPLLAWSPNQGVIQSRPVCSHSSSIWYKPFSVANVFTITTSPGGVTLLLLKTEKWHWERLKYRPTEASAHGNLTLQCVSECDLKRPTQDPKKKKNQKNNKINKIKTVSINDTIYKTTSMVREPEHIPYCKIKDCAASLQ